MTALAYSATRRVPWTALHCPLLLCSFAFQIIKTVVDGALKWLDNPPKEPWLLFLPLQFPHPPFTVEEPFFSMYDRKQMPVPASREEKAGYLPRFMTTLRAEMWDVALEWLVATPGALP
ncbi:hypothetical protein ACJZ2D_002656 [Fusarium nematophilum]